MASLRLAVLSPKYRPLLRPVNSHSTAPSLRAIHSVAPTSQLPADSSVPAGDNLETRKASPAHYLVNIDSFSLFDKLQGIEKYETRGFQAGGYDWKLKIYPHGNGCNHDKVSVNLALADTSAFPPNWEVNVVSSISLFNHKTDSYNYALDRFCFNAMNTESGFPTFISKNTLMDPSNGYLKGDKCVFGAEVFVNENKAVTENMSLKNFKYPPYKLEFKVPNFPSLKNGWEINKTTWTSEEFTAGGCRWKISVFRDGKEGHKRDGKEGLKLSSLLQRVDSKDSLVRADYTLSLKTKLSDEEHVTKKTGQWFPSPPTKEPRWSGWEGSVDLDSLFDPYEGYKTNGGCVHLEIDLSLVALKV